jgi:hypothetical protein
VTIATIPLNGGGTSYARAWPVAATSMYRHADYAGDAPMAVSVGATVLVPRRRCGTLYHTPKFLFGVVNKMKGCNIWIKLVNISLDFYIFLLKKMCFLNISELI